MAVQPYRIPAPRPDPYGDAWARLRKRRLARRLSIAVFVYLVVTALILALHGEDIRPLHTGLSMFQIAVVLVLVFLGVASTFASYLVPLVCPRCEQPFFHGLFMEIGFTKHCVNCDLAVGTPTPLSEEREEVDE